MGFKKKAHILTLKSVYHWITNLGWRKNLEVTIKCYSYLKRGYWDVYILVAPDISRPAEPGGSCGSDSSPSELIPLPLMKILRSTPLQSVDNNTLYSSCHISFYKTVQTLHNWKTALNRDFLLPKQPQDSLLLFNVWGSRCSDVL